MLFRNRYAFNLIWPCIGSGLGYWNSSKFLKSEIRLTKYYPNVGKERLNEILQDMSLFKTAFIISLILFLSATLIAIFKPTFNGRIRYIKEGIA